MARPRKDGLEYFPHDVFASSDEKIEPLLLLFGAKGYAFYFLHLEYIYRRPDVSFCVSDAETRQILCNKLQISEQEYDSILNACLRRGCFDKEHYEKTGCLTSSGIKKRAKVVIEKRQKMRELHGKSKADKPEWVSDAETTQIGTVSGHKVKERKVKESKEGNRAAFHPPDIQTVSAYCRERGNSVDAERFVDFYASKGWMVGKNKMKDWKAAVRTWEQKDSTQPQGQKCPTCTYEQRCKERTEAERAGCTAWRAAA